MQSHQHPERLVPALLLAVVVLLVVIAGSLLVGLSREPAPLTQASAGSEVLPEILRSLQRIEDQLVQITAELGAATTVRVAASTASGATAPDPPGVKGTQEVRRKLEDLPRVDGRTGVDWASVINKSLARCLVEYAKTPFDEGVAPLLRQATRELAAIQKEYLESVLPLQAQYERQMEELKGRFAELEVTKAAFRQELQPLRDARDDGEEQVRVRFRESLEALDS